MSTSTEKNERPAKPNTEISQLPFMSGRCRTGPEARLMREKMTNVDLSDPEDVLARLKMGQETVE